MEKGAETKKVAENKARVYAILDGTAESSLPRIESSVLKHFSTVATPALVGPEQPIMRGILLTCLAVVVLIFLEAIDVGYALKLVGLVLAATAAFDAWLRALEAQRKIRRETLEVRPPLLELKGIRDHLHNYLEQVDRRTSRYFHCVTNTKLTTFCVLRQIHMALEARVVEIEKLTAWPTAISVMEAFELFKKVLIFCDGFYPDTGQVFALPLYELKHKSLLLIEDLDAGLEDLEELIKVQKSVAPEQEVEH